MTLPVGQIIQGDGLEVMADWLDGCVDTVITDPPYGLSFMGKNWDHGIPGVAYWAECLRVAKPGAFLLAFGGTRTFHRLTCAIEDAGWQIRDCMMWLYGSGFPKSMDISKAIDKVKGAEREIIQHRTGPRPGTHGGSGQYGHGEDRSITAPATDLARAWQGWGTALKPAWEPIIVAMKPCDGTFAANAEKHGVAGLNIDGGRIQTHDNLNGGAYSGESGNREASSYVIGQHAGKFAPPAGRFPANLILDEAAAEMLDEQSGTLTSGQPSGNRKALHHWSTPEKGTELTGFGDTGGASRFFYCAKASRSERGPGNDHPTVKPLKLMRYLVRLTATPTGGLVMDPFAGSGTTCVAAKLEGRPFIGIELDAEGKDFCGTARRRLLAAEAPLFATEATL